MNGSRKPSYLHLLIFCLFDMHSHDFASLCLPLRLSYLARFVRLKNKPLFIASDYKGFELNLGNKLDDASGNSFLEF